jgi:PAS domain S-box-containing protein
VFSPPAKESVSRDDAAERLELLSELAGVGFWRWRAGEDENWCDEVCRALAGIREGEASTVESLLAAIEPRDRQRVMAAIEAMVEGAPAFRETVRIVAERFVAPRWLVVSGRARRGEDGRVWVEGVLMDDGGRARAEEARRLGEERLRVATEAAQVVVWDMDLTTGWTRCSPNAVGIWGFEEGPAEKFFERVHPEDREQLGPVGELVGEGEARYSREYRVITVRGETRWIHCRGEVIRDERGKPLRLVGVSMDVTERRIVESALRETQARERTYLEHLPVGVWFINAEGQVAYGNVAGRQIWAGARYVGMEDLGEYKGWWHGTERRLLAEEWAGARAIRFGQSSLNEVIDIECFDGTRKTILNSAVPVRDGEGRISGAVVLNQDVTELKDAERRLRESESTLRSFYETSPILMGVVEIEPDDSDILHIHYNVAAGKLHGMPPSDGRARGSRELGATSGQLAEWVSRYRQSERSGQPVWFEFLQAGPGGGSWYYCVVAKVGPGSAGRTRFSFVAQDITQRKRIEIELHEAQAKLHSHAAQLERLVEARTAELRDTNEQLETFVYTVAHDLRGPLRAATGFAQLLVEDYSDRLDATGRHMLERIQGTSEFMDRLVLDLLSFGRAARAQVDMTEVSLSRVWEAAWFQCAVQAESLRAVVEAAEPLPMVRGHEATLGQMLANLLGNALKFVAPGVTPKVRIWAERRGEKVRLWVEDNGIGIPAEQHERVFRVFERLHGARFEGTGVGLAIVRKGAERMGGSAGVESTPGEGSRFWIELPRG